jgi:hypothetical protein
MAVMQVIIGRKYSDGVISGVWLILQAIFEW